MDGILKNMGSNLEIQRPKMTKAAGAVLRRPLGWDNMTSYQRALYANCAEISSAACRR